MTHLKDCWFVMQPWLVKHQTKTGSIGDDQYSTFSEIVNLLKGLAHPKQAVPLP